MASTEVSRPSTASRAARAASTRFLSGRLLLTRGPTEAELDEQEIGPGHAWRVEPGTVHSIEALEDSVVLEVSTPHLEDVVRLRDRYQRS